MQPSRPDEVLAELLDVAAKIGLRPVLMGGYAVAVWGVPRATFDVDVLVEADDAGLEAFFTACEGRGFQVDPIYRTGWRDRVRDMPLVKVVLFRSGRPITSDVFLVTTPLQRAASARSIGVELPGLSSPVRIVSAADLVLLKLLADRPKDRLDVQNVLTVQGMPDRDYLRSWANLLGVGDRLTRALRDAGLSAE